MPLLTALAADYLTERVALLPFGAVVTSLRALQQAQPPAAWPIACHSSLASSLMAAVLLSQPLDVRALVEWAWKHSGGGSAGGRYSSRYPDDVPSGHPIPSSHYLRR